jgi:hypothetical protein
MFKQFNKMFRPKGRVKVTAHFVPVFIGIVFAVAAVGAQLVPLTQKELESSKAPVSKIKLSNSSKKIHSSSATNKSQPNESAPAVIAPTAAPVTAPAVPKTVVSAVRHTAATTPATPKVEPVVIPSPSSRVSGLTPTNPTPITAPVSTSPTTTSTPAPATPTTTSYTSTNWSGYLATANAYTSVSGSWLATSPTGNGTSTSADSTWIGIGGVTSEDLIQVGTQNTVSPSGRVISGAFYEMLPASSTAIPTLTVTPGDSMSATLTETSSGHWLISIADNTNEETFSDNVIYASTNSSAEWIEEDPSTSGNRQFPFDNFLSAQFTNAFTTSSGTNSNLNTAEAQPITMDNRSGEAVATPSVIDNVGDDFTIAQNTP